LLALFGFGAAQTTSQERLVIGSSGELSTLDPRVGVDVFSFERISAIMEPLVVFAPDLSLEPRLAESWTFSDDGLTLTFNLRQGVMFHHGREFTAADARYTLEWVLDPDNAAQNRPLYADIESIDTPDDSTLVLNLSEANAFLLNNIARLPVVPHDLGDDEGFASNPVGTGPYRFESLTRDDRLVLTAFPDYWGGRGSIDVVEFRPIPEDGTRLLALEGGELDMYQGNVVPSELARLEADERFVVDRTPAAGYVYLGMNNVNEPLGNVQVRQAISYMIPREAIVERILEGVGRPGISMIIPDMPWFNPDVMRFDYDPERARELLAEAGFEEGGFSLRLYTDENPARVQIAEILQAELAQVGIDMSVNVEEFGAVLDRFLDTDDYDLFLLSWNGQLDPDRAMFRQFTTGGAFSGFINYSNPRVDELVNRGRLVPPDSQESIAIYQEAQAIIVEEAPYAFIFYIEEVALAHADITGWQVHPYNAVTYQNLHRVGLSR
jgi:peptide/nickel transport system substrate-binding protein